jgi:hypothetical protein
MFENIFGLQNSRVGIFIVTKLVQSLLIGVKIYETCRMSWVKM